MFLYFVPQKSWLSYFLVLRKIDRKKTLIFFTTTNFLYFYPLVFMPSKRVRVFFSFSRIFIFTLPIPMTIITVSWQYRLNTKSGLNKFVYLNSNNKLEYYRITGCSMLSSLSVLIVIYFSFSFILPSLIDNCIKVTANCKNHINRRISPS